MNQTEKLLEQVAENAEMGLASVERLLKKAEDEPIRRELRREADVYRDLKQEAMRQLKNRGLAAKHPPAFQRAMTSMGIEMETAMDISPSHIADMVIQGATMGVTELTKARHTYSDADADAQGVASAFITSQQDAIDKMKEFLVFDKAP